MFCGNCGAQNADNAVFCKECGAPLQSQQGGQDVAGTTGGAATTVREGGGNKTKLFIIIGVAVAAIVAIVLLIVLLGGVGGGGGYKGLVDNMFKACYKKADGEAFLKLFPDEVIEELCDSTDTTRKKLVKQLSNSFEDEIDEFNDDYDKWSYSYKITDTEDLSKKELKKLQEKYEDDLDVDITIKEAVKLEVKLTMKLDDDEDSDKMELTAIKVGSKWYLDISSLLFMFR